MRVVFDTNIFISAFVIPGCLAETAIIKMIEGQDTLVISKEIMKDILSDLSHKFSRDKEAISHVAVVLSELGELVSPTKTKKINIFKDEGDNRIMECALFGEADVVVTGDKGMLKQKEYEGVRIISLKE